MELYVRIIFIAISLTTFAARIDSSCAGSSYSITTTGCGNSNPSPEDATEGVPFLPECEEEKCFRVDSIQPGLNIALFLSRTPYISDPATDEYYEIRIENSVSVSIIRSGNSIPSASAPIATGDILPGDEICVYVNNDDTIHVNHNGGGYVFSWQDTIDPVDVNYVLVQTYNDPNGDTAIFKFCDGVLELLSQNTLSVGQTVDATDSKTSNAANTIDGDKSGGIYNSNDCHEILPACTGAEYPLGMADGSITDSQISASSEYSAPSLAAANARLNQGNGVDGSGGSWAVDSGMVNANQWIQVDLGTPTLVTGVITQGRDGTSQWVTMFTVEYSTDCITWQNVDNGAVNIAVHY
ncbi:uncharacterized protein [Amphiura filiformis]|uniref:uncharacterized protein n=1 Tax=Amphiura filiformis TaxID=82378 RepID=UPI003B21420F